MSPEEFVTFLTDKKSKMSHIIYYSMLAYTSVVVMTSIYILSTLASSEDATASDCTQWTTVDIPTTSGKDVTASVCTQLTSNQGSSSGNVPNEIKYVAFLIFFIYVGSQYTELRYFQSFRHTFEDVAGLDGANMYSAMFYGNVIQSVCVMVIGLVLIVQAETPLDAIINSTAAVFLGEADDCLLTLVIRGKLMQRNLEAEVETEVFGIEITCPPMYLKAGLLDKFQQNETIVRTVRNLLPHRIKEIVETAVELGGTAYGTVKEKVHPVLETMLLQGRHSRGTPAAGATTSTSSDGSTSGDANSDTSSGAGNEPPASTPNVGTGTSTAGDGSGSERDGDSSC